MIELLSLVVTIIGIVLIPIVKFLFTLATRLTVLESQKDIYADFHTEYRSDVDKLFDEIKSLRKEINKKAENYVHVNSCKSNGCGS